MRRWYFAAPAALLLTFALSQGQGQNLEGQTVRQTAATREGEIFAEKIGNVEDRKDYEAYVDELRNTFSLPERKRLQKLGHRVPFFPIKWKNFKHRNTPELGEAVKKYIGEVKEARSSLSAFNKLKDFIRVKQDSLLYDRRLYKEHNLALPTEVFEEYGHTDVDEESPELLEAIESYNFRLGEARRLLEENLGDSEIYHVNPRPRIGLERDNALAHAMETISEGVKDVLDHLAYYTQKFQGQNKAQKSVHLQSYLDELLTELSNLEIEIRTYGLSPEDRLDLLPTIYTAEREVNEKIAELEYMRLEKAEFEDHASKNARVKAIKKLFKNVKGLSKVETKFAKRFYVPIPQIDYEIDKGLDGNIRAAVEKYRRELLRTKQGISKIIRELIEKKKKKDEENAKYEEQLKIEEAKASAEDEELVEVLVERPGSDTDFAYVRPANPDYASEDYDYHDYYPGQNEEHDRLFTGFNAFKYYDDANQPQEDEQDHGFVRKDDPDYEDDEEEPELTPVKVVENVREEVPVRKPTLTRKTTSTRKISQPLSPEPLKPIADEDNIYETESELEREAAYLAAIDRAQAAAKALVKDIVKAEAETKAEEARQAVETKAETTRAEMKAPKNEDNSPEVEDSQEETDDGSNRSGKSKTLISPRVEVMESDYKEFPFVTPAGLALGETEYVDGGDEDFHRDVDEKGVFYKWYRHGRRKDFPRDIILGTKHVPTKHFSDPLYAERVDAFTRAVEVALWHREYDMAEEMISQVNYYGNSTFGGAMVNHIPSLVCQQCARGDQAKNFPSYARDVILGYEMKEVFSSKDIALINDHNWAQCGFCLQKYYLDADLQYTPSPDIPYTYAEVSEEPIGPNHPLVRRDDNYFDVQMPWYFANMFRIIWDKHGDDSPRNIIAFTQTTLEYLSYFPSFVDRLAEGRSYRALTADMFDGGIFADRPTFLRFTKHNREVLFAKEMEKDLVSLLGKEEYVRMQFVKMVRGKRLIQSPIEDYKPYIANANKQKRVFRAQDGVTYGRVLYKRSTSDLEKSSALDRSAELLETGLYQSGVSRRDLKAWKHFVIRWRRKNRSITELARRLLNDESKKVTDQRLKKVYAILFFQLSEADKVEMLSNIPRLSERQVLPFDDLGLAEILVVNAPKFSV